MFLAAHTMDRRSLFLIDLSGYQAYGPRGEKRTANQEKPPPKPTFITTTEMKDR